MGKSIAEIIARIAGADSYVRKDLFEAPVFLPPPPSLVSLNQRQREAVEQIVAWRVDLKAARVMSLTGAAGTGKSTIMHALAARLRGTRTAWAAMTGKAASRLKEAAGVRGRTLHSVLYQQPREVDNAAEQKIDLEFDQVQEVDGSCLLVVDESSMISPKIRADIERSGYEKVLLVGDPYQLPPVLSRVEEQEQGGDYSVFTGVVGPHLNEVMRTSGAVLRAATHVREQQQLLESSEEDGGSIYTYRPVSSVDEALLTALDAWFEDREDHVLVTWRNETRMTANRILREALGFSDPLPQPGEPLVVRRNCYRDGLMNGDQLRVLGWEGDGPTLCGVETKYLRATTVLGEEAFLLVPSVDFSGVLPYVGLDEWKRAIRKADCDDPVPMTWGYCLTGHLTQGSEWRRVTTFLPGDLTNPYFKKQTRLPDGQLMRFSTRFIYTALARAQKHTTLIVSK